MRLKYYEWICIRERDSLVVGKLPVMAKESVPFVTAMIATIGKVRDAVLPAVCQKGVVIVGRKAMKKEKVFNKILVIKLWREGLTVGDIARKLDADIRIVSDITEEYEAKRRGGKIDEGI